MINNNRCTRASLARWVSLTARRSFLRRAHPASQLLLYQHLYDPRTTRHSSSTMTTPSTTCSTSLSVEKLNPLGVKLTNVDLSNSEHLCRIPELLYENGVIVIPPDGGAAEEPIYADASLLKLSKLFGQVENYHPVNEAKDQEGKVQILETMGDSGIPADSFLFHSDMSWRFNPSRASVLCASKLPEKGGGNTCFQSANAMYRNLSPELKQRLQTVSALHSLKYGYAKVNRPDDVKGEDIQAVHPAVIKHPATGVPLLYLNENFTMNLVGMSEQESEVLMKQVFQEVSNRPGQVLSHSWTPGDVVIWDNYGVQHLARADYQGLRRMHRVVAHDPDMKTERYIEEGGGVEENKQQQPDSSSASQYDSIRSPFAVREILGFVRPGDAVLDAGCGTGQHAEHIAAKAAKVVGIEMDVERVAIAQDRCHGLKNVRFAVGSVVKLPFDAGSFDVVMLAQVLHHLGGDDDVNPQVHVLLENCNQALMEAKRVLRPGGRLVLVTTSLEQRREAYWHFKLFPQSAWERLHYVWTLTEGEWFRSVMQELGFVAVDSATPSESHWMEVDEQMVKSSLDAGWRSTDVAFALLTPDELCQFEESVKDILASGSAQDLISAASAGRAKYGEATVSVYQIR